MQVPAQPPFMGAQHDGRAAALQAEGCGFNSRRFHHTINGPVAKRGLRHQTLNLKTMGSNPIWPANHG